MIFPTADPFNRLSGIDDENWLVSVSLLIYLFVRLATDLAMEVDPLNSYMVLVWSSVGLWLVII